ncbi:MAG: ChbG/HpnK family deacetylase [Proteobacteria bacterium]|nr:ChbG/HpnK family deacetylase [Pseudomonadota bacterium]
MNQVAESAPEHRLIAFSADDYGLAPGIGSAVRELLAAGRLSATGCMTTGPFWPAEAASLRAIGGAGFEVGLHLTLTDQASLTRNPSLAPEGRLPPLGRLIGRAFTGRLDGPAIEAELNAQLDRFEAEFGRPPDFLDGHHHVHQLPVIGNVVLDVFERRLRRHGAWIRRCQQSARAAFGHGIDIKRSLAISMLGLGFARRADAKGIAGNVAFSGVRAFHGEPAYGELVRRWLLHAPSGTLIMCHPGFVDPPLTAADTLTAPREEEYRYLSSPAFPAVLAELGCQLVPPLALKARRFG